jgi:hypothetical protein
MIRLRVRGDFVCFKEEYDTRRRFAKLADTKISGCSRIGLTRNVVPEARNFLVELIVDSKYLSHVIGLITSRSAHRRSLFHN